MTTETNQNDETNENDGHDRAKEGPGGTGPRSGEASGGEGEREGEGRAGAGRSSTRPEMPFADNIHGLVDDIIEGVRSFTPVGNVRYPRYDFIETPGAYLLAFDLPGVTREQISVQTEGEDVVVSGQRARPEWGDEATVRRRERPFGGFRRAVRLAADVRIDEIRARLEDGILTVTLPRHGEAGAKKVDIEG